jgi:chromosome segregation ATPase
MISEAVHELRMEFAASLERLATLVENRSAWSDAIAGCQEALVMITDATAKLKAVHESTLQLESDLATARAENATLSRNYAELERVERDLRGELWRNQGELKQLQAEAEDLRKKHAASFAAERELRTEVEQHRAALEQRSAAVASAQALAKQLVSETTCL